MAASVTCDRVVLSQFLGGSLDALVVGLEGLVILAEKLVLNRHVVVANCQDRRLRVIVSSIIQKPWCRRPSICIALQQLERTLAVLEGMSVSVQARENSAKVEVRAGRVVGFRG